MPDTRLDKILTLGTDADRLAFVPDPPTDVLVCWYATDTSTLWAWDGAWQQVATGGGGTGDVVGPASSVDDQIATFDGITGKLVQDGGKTIATVVSDAVTAATAAIVPIDLTTDVSGVLPAAHVGAHASTHASAGSDPVTVTALAGFPGGTTTFLRADGTFAAGTGTAASGAVILLADVSASASASLDVTTRNAAGQSGATFQSDYDHYRIELTQVLPATATVTGFFRVSTDGGSTWISAASSYFYGGLRHVSNSPTSTAFNDSSYASTYGLLGAAINNTAGYGLCGVLELWTPTTAGAVHAWRVQMGLATAGGSIDEYLVRGLSMNTSAITAIQFAMTSGNIASGRIRIYGIG